MKKIIRLTESDLSRIVRRVIKEKIEDYSKMLGALIGPEEYFRLLKMDRNKCMEFQKWVKQNYPQTNLGNSGPRRDGVDGICGKLTTAAFGKYGEEFVMEVINGKRDNDDDVNDNGAIPQNAFRDCEELSRVEDEDMLGSPSVVSMNGSVEISHFIDGGPNYESFNFKVNGKPFCKLSLSRFKKNNCEFVMDSGAAPGDSPKVKLSGKVQLSHYTGGGPSYESWKIINNGKYFCKVSV